MGRRIRSWFTSETFLFWVITLIVCAIVALIGYQVGRNFVGKHLAAETQTRDIAAAPAPAPADKPVTRRSLAPRVVVLDRAPTEAERIEYEAIEDQGAGETPDQQSAEEASAEETQPPEEHSGQPGEQNTQMTEGTEGAAPQQSPEAQSGAESSRQGEGSPPSGPRWIATAGSYKDRSNAEQVAASLGAQGMKVSVIPVTVHGEVFHRVVVGPFDSRDDALTAAAQVQSAGYPSQVMQQR